MSKENAYKYLMEISDKIGTTEIQTLPKIHGDVMRYAINVLYEGGKDDE